jgi:hypothetical protein
MAAVVTEEEKSRARHHLGYPEVDAVSTFALGIPAAMQTNFMIEGAFNRISQSSAERFRLLLCRLDAVEEQVFCSADLTDVNKVDTIEINRKWIIEKAKIYKIAQQALGNLLAVPPNPFDMREWLQGGSINVGVSG